MAPMTKEDDGMDCYRLALTKVCDELIAAGKISSMNDWMKKAGIKSGSTIRNFMHGRSRSLSIETYARLAAFANRPIADLLGEVAPVSDKERLILQAYRQARESGKAVLEAQAKRELEGQ